MFRKMRRFKQQLPQEEAIKILEEGQTGVLAVLGDDNYPYAVPINYAYKDGKIYFHGAKEGHKQDAIVRNSKVSLCVIAQDTLVKDELTTYFKSVIAFGQARVLTDEQEIYKAAEIFGLKYNDDQEKVANEIKREWPALRCVEITIEHLTGKEAIELTRARAK
ncbi:MAG: pyridoxamine 5'-phosphate oxidase family protein [Erysipelotrichia bacterium]|nr:pyridoxamine 5'-phosphate oxidase family protein [Erysipelotrichia bacterium]